MKPALPLLAALLLAPSAALYAEEHLIQPGDDPQAVMEAAAAGDRIVFQPGLHQHFPGKYRALLYVDKSVEIELKEGATLRLADHATQLQAAPEITTDQDAGKKLDDLAVAGEFDLSRPSIFTIVTDAEGHDGKADTFAWGVFHSVDNPQGSTRLGPTESKFNETPHRGVPITGDWQELTQGVKIRFGSQTGHNQGSRWFITYDGPEAYGIRIGHGRQAEYIENVRVTGRGAIDMNAAHNIQPGFLVKNINACVLIHGRVRGVVVERITMTDTNRSVMCYGEHSGKFLPGGGVTPGESFDAENITIQHTRTLNPNGAAYLLGHPSFRGQLRNVKCNHNYMETAVTAIEPNFNLDGYEVIGNVIKSGGHAIHCWRNSKNGVIADNLRIHDNSGKPVVILGAPAGWEKPEPPRLRNNRNHLSDSGDTSLVAEGAQVTKLAGDMKFTEGPVWLPAEEKLVFSDIPNGKWMQWTEDGGASVYRPSEQANGNILDLEGRLISCQHEARNLKPVAALGAAQAAAGYYLIGNSLTWDTVPQRLDGDVQWHVDCGVSLPHIFANPDQPCVKESTVWPQALRDKQYDIVSVQPHYGSTLAQDVETISNWMKLQTRAVFVVHSGWAFHAQRANEFASLATPGQMAHSPTYLRALVAELRRLHPGREIRQTLAQNLLALIAEDIDAGRAPIKEIAELYRDPIHMTPSHGRYLMHNAMRRAFGQPPSAAGFENLHPEVKQYLDGVLELLTTTAADRSLLQRVLSSEETADRAALIGNVSEKGLRDRLVALLPEIERALKARRGTLHLESQIEAVGGKLICTPSAPQWLYLATGDRGTEIFDVPTAVDLYNGNNPLKGKGGRNEKVTDEWLEHLVGVVTLRRVDLANCAIKGDGLRHISKLTDLREVNLTLTPVTDDALRHLAGLSELRVLGLASTQCTGTGFTHLKGLQKLESVNFHFTPLNDDGLRAITQVPISDRLWFAHTRFTDEGAAGLSNLTHLRRCGIGSTDKASSGEAVAALAKLPLEELTLLDNQATLAGLAFAARIATLRRLDVSHAPTVTDESLHAVSRMPALEEFRLGSAQVTDKGLMELATSKSLKKLSLAGLKQVTPAGIERLRKARPELQIEVK